MVNWSAIVFNNLYNKLWGLSAPTKFSASRDNTKFGATQVVDIIFWNCFPIDLTFIWMELDEEKEGLVKPLSKAQIVRTTKIPKCTHKCWWEDGGCRKNQWDEYPTRNLEVTRNLIDVEVLEFGSTSSLKSYSVLKEAHFGGTITKSENVWVWFELNKFLV